MTYTNMQQYMRTYRFRSFYHFDGKRKGDNLVEF